MSKWLSILIFVLSIFVPTIPAETVSAAESATETLVISEIQTGGCAAFVSDTPPVCDGEDGKKEFVELRNLLPIAIWLDNWKLEYISASGATVTELATLKGRVDANSTMLVSYDGYRPHEVVPDMFFAKMNSTGLLAKSGGHVRLTKDTKVIDLVGWGSATATGAWPKVPALLPEYSIMRILPDDPLHASGVTFAPATFPTSPESGGFTPEQPDVPDDPGEETEDPQAPNIQPACEGIIVSEVLPNPEGADAGGEFIELYNPTVKPIALDGCLLGLSGTGKTYPFVANTQLEPGEYRAFYDDVTGITLPNAAGGEALLVNGNTEYPFSYPKAMKDNESWALITNTWQATDRPTPGAENMTMTPQVAGQQSVGDEELRPCAAGKFRNPETNRCKNIVTMASALTPCRPGQTRNPETNRCRNAVLAEATLIPCKAGQKRNPETNRCRSTLTASTVLKPCDEGEERNPETNRCRKVAATLASTPTDSKQTADKSKINYGILGLVGASVLGYGAYEYRNDFRNKFANLRGRFFARKSGK